MYIFISIKKMIQQRPRTQPYPGVLENIETVTRAIFYESAPLKRAPHLIQFYGKFSRLFLKTVSV